MDKQNLGQFFTTNADYILTGFGEYVKGKEIVDPFAGSGDLLSWATKNGAKSITGYDIDKKLICKSIKLNDSLLSIPESPFVLTNPPYRANNKMSQKLKAKYLSEGVDDFYLLAIQN